MTGQFRKDIKLAKKQNRDLEKMYETVGRLAEGEKLDLRYRDHELSGKLTGTRECHIEGDWLLIYEVIEEKSALVLDRLGTHSELLRS